VDGRKAGFPHPGGKGDGSRASAGPLRRLPQERRDNLQIVSPNIVGFLSRSAHFGYSTICHADFSSRSARLLRFRTQRHRALHVSARRPKQPRRSQPGPGFQRRIPAEDFHRTKRATRTTATAKLLERRPRFSERRTDSFTPASPPATPPRTKMIAICQSTRPARA
jgi:hypothetical protein